MLENATIELAIGVTLLFFVVSLAGSLLVEAIGGFFHRRSKNLWDTIDQLFEGGSIDGKRLIDSIYGSTYVTSLIRPATRRVLAGEPAATSRRAPIRGAKKVLSERERRVRFYGPQHISSRNFADALIETLRPQGTADTALSDLTLRIDQLPQGLETQLGAALTGAERTLSGVRAAIESWYERYMNSVSFWFRRQTRWFLFIVGVVLAVALNVDAIGFANTLYRDDQVREAVVAQAAEISETDCETVGGDESKVECLREGIDDAVTLPIGWGSDLDTSGGAWSLRLLGWIVTAAAVTAGAPFWFDIMRRALALRRSDSRKEDGGANANAAR